MPRPKKLIKRNIFALGLLAGAGVIALGALKLKPPTHQVVSESKISSAEVSSGFDYLEVPKLNISTPIVYSDSDEESDIQKSLIDGAVHLAGTAMPGETGNAYFVGHSSNFNNAPGNYNEIFKDLPKIAVGDQILISRGGYKYKFTVYQTRIVEPTELWVMSQETNGLAVLTLQTSYPVGTSRQRFVAMARLSR